jgi:HAE1 family hydrophobic/amphiphilic exporter-1
MADIRAVSELRHAHLRPHAQRVLDDRSRAIDRPRRKNSILLVDRANQLREEGLAIDEALLEACPTRLRPILMTSFTIIFAMMVPALGLGAGVELSAPLAVAVVGGMVTSTLLSLVVVPAVYSLVDNRRARSRQRLRNTAASTK